MDIGSLNYGDRVYFDSVTGVAGIEWPVGTPQLPSDVIADVITILTARYLHTIEIHGGLTLAATMNHYCFIGHEHEAAGDILNLGGQDVDDSHFERLTITGVQGGAGLATFTDCLFVATIPIPMSGFRGWAKNCALFGGLGIALATGNADYADFDHCTSIHGVATVIIGSPDRVSFKNFSGGLILAAQVAGAALVRGIEGYLEVDEMTGGTLDIYSDTAEIQINADCTGGTINIYGSATVTDDSPIGCTVNDYTEQDDRAEQTAELIAADMALVTAFGSGSLLDSLEQTLCSLDAIGGTKKDVKVTVYLDADVVAAGIIERWYVTSLAAPATFVLKQPENAQHDPGAACVLTREFGDLPEGLQLQFRILSAGDDTGVHYECEMTYLS